MDPGPSRSGRTGPRRNRYAMSVQFAVLASGSSANATLIQAGGAGVLLDLGLGPRALGQRLESVGSSWERIAAALLTHTHGDHVEDATLHAMARRGVFLYCHEGHRAGLGGLSGFRALEAADLVRHFADAPFLTPSGLRIEPLPLRHDSGPTFGFRIEVSTRGRSGRPVALGYLADTGCWSEALAEAMADVDLLGVEFNHDVEMQRRSGRSPALIARVLGDRGHLSNAQGADLVTAVVARSRPGTLRHLVLLHLSRQCNLPGLALDVARSAIRGTGRRVALHAAEQATAHPNLWVVPTRRRSSAGRSREADPAAAAAAGPRQATLLGLDVELA
jgi:phosphoribosyl 1,2-cyclic phosphodiesterase